MTPPQGNELTPREVQILELIGNGVPYKIAVSQLGITAYMYWNATKIIQRKLGAKNIPNMIMLAAKDGII